jgi:pimeloyl-ACP methyl ester carboxylesterase
VSALLDSRLLHYEVFGRGQPIIFLHSWLGSWRYWVSTMEHAAERYRAYALDFWGFGESERERGGFSVDEYVALLYRFMDNMGIPRANLVGHGLGGMVAVRAAREQPNRFLKVMIVATPLQGSVVTQFSKQGTLSRLFGRSAPSNAWTKIIKQMDFDDPEMVKEIQEDTEALSEEVVTQVQDSMQALDLRADLAELDLPLLAAYGEKDTIVPVEHAKFIGADSRHPHQLITLPRSNHFPFLDQPTIFQRLLTDFLASQGTPVEIKELWRRKVTQREYL